MDEIATSSGDKRSIGVKYGLISAVVGIVFFLVLVFAGQNPFLIKWGWAVSLTATLALLILAQREYKADNNGYMTYGEGLGVGLWYALVGVVVYQLFTYVYVSFIDTNIMTEFYENQYEQMQTQNMPDEQIEIAQSWTKKLFWVFGTLGAIFMTMVAVLLVTIFTQKRPPEQRI